MGGRGADMEGCGQCMKYTLWIVNVVCLIGGITVLGIGAWIVSDQTYMQDLLGTRLYISCAYIMVCTGVLITFISIMGCFGAIKEVKCMLLTYAVFLFFIFVVLLVGGILGFVFRGEAEETIKKEMTVTLDKYNNNTNIKKAWDDAQQLLNCCGVESYKEWNAKLPGNQKVPESCCIDPKVDCTKDPTAENTFSDGCVLKVKNNVKENARLLGAVALVIAFLMIVGIIFSCALYKTV